ncbi:MAG: ion transporter [Pirellulaceae bacterium]
MLPHERHIHQERRRQCPSSGLRRTLYIIIFESDTPLGKLFDVGLLIAILASIAVVSMETVDSLSRYYSEWFIRMEWTFTILFTLEYVTRLICVRRPMRYAFSFWGVIDLLSILPTFLFFFAGPHFASFAMVRSIRLLRVFRVMKLLRLMTEAEDLYRSIWESRGKIVVFLFTVVIAVTLSGTLMYHVENFEDHLNNRRPSSSFDSIPQSMYWAIVTMTTVGYGDVVPKTTAGKAISAVLILLGYSLIIVPTGFVTAKLSQVTGSLHADNADDSHPSSPLSCERCGRKRHPHDARFCNQCGERLISR